MLSLDLSSHDDAPPRRRSVRRILDLAFGFFVWAIHFLVIYIVAAVACVLGLGAASEAMQNSLLGVLTVVTLAAAAIVVVHAVRRYRSQRAAHDQHFRMSVTGGCDAIAVVAIAGQFLP